MFDINLRPIKDSIFNPLCRAVPGFITPLQVTLYGVIAGLISCYLAAIKRPFPALAFWILNRTLDCLDGAIARHREQVSDLGGFLDLLADFIIYSLIPIASSWPLLSSAPSLESRGVALPALSVALLEATFHVNNFVLFYVGAVVEKRKAMAAHDDNGGVKELTSVAMRPALIEGTESGLLFTAMLAMPSYIEPLSWTMAVLVSIGIVQRVIWLAPLLQ